MSEVARVVRQPAIERHTRIGEIISSFGEPGCNPLVDNYAQSIGRGVGRQERDTVATRKLLAAANLLYAGSPAASILTDDDNSRRTRFLTRTLTVSLQRYHDRFPEIGSAHERQEFVDHRAAIRNRYLPHVEPIADRCLQMHVMNQLHIAIPDQADEMLEEAIDDARLVIVYSALQLARVNRQLGHIVPEQGNV